MPCTSYSAHCSSSSSPRSGPAPGRSPRRGPTCGPSDSSFGGRLAVRIVVNADDFGASTETVAATIDSFEAGSLTSATIMPTMPAAEQALAFARGRPDWSFGVHLTFVGNGDERCAADPAAVRALVDEAG